MYSWYLNCYGRPPGGLRHLYRGTAAALIVVPVWVYNVRDTRALMRLLGNFKNVFFFT